MSKAKKSISAVKHHRKSKLTHNPNPTSDVLDPPSLAHSARKRVIIERDNMYIFNHGFISVNGD
jgi:hypothetical protein